MIRIANFISTRGLITIRPLNLSTITVEDNGSVSGSFTGTDDYGSVNDSPSSTSDNGSVPTNSTTPTEDVASFNQEPGTYPGPLDLPGGPGFTSFEVNCSNRTTILWNVVLNSVSNDGGGTNPTVYGTGSSSAQSVTFGIVDDGYHQGTQYAVFTLTGYDSVLDQTFTWEVTCSSQSIG